MDEAGSAEMVHPTGEPRIVANRTEGGGPRAARCANFAKDKIQRRKGRAACPHAAAVLGTWAKRRLGDKAPYLWAAAGAAALAVAGWYFGLHAPEQRRVEKERLRVEQVRLEYERLEQERLAAEREADQQRILAEQEAERQRELAAQEAERQRLAAEQARREAARGGVNVRTIPAGAEVRVGAVALERSPLTLSDQRLGTYPVRIRLEDYEDWDGSIEVTENEFTELNVALTRSTGELLIGSDPPGLEVTVDGVKVPGAPASRTVLTPTRLEGLPTGDYTLTYRRPDWPERVQTVRVERQTTASALAEFAGGGLQVTSQPRGAEVWSQGRRLGTTPLTLNDLPPGNFEFEFRLANHLNATGSGQVEARETTRVQVALKEIRGPQPGQRFTLPDLGMDLMPIPAGSFQMGTASGGENNERPVTQVTISRPFWLARTEVTQRQWQVVMGNNPSRFKGDNQPVEQVSWKEAMEFCRMLTERERLAGRLQEGYVYTLPTEAQWEYAARAGTTGDYGGTGRLIYMGWYDRNSGASTKPVGTKEANAWGLHDMHGNVWEWCLDWFGIYPGGSVTDPTGPTSGSDRVFRGGSFWNSADSCRSSFRLCQPPVFRMYHLGFRPALTPSH
jgi:formylglycine-generating enzyme required for sulfatase activity